MFEKNVIVNAISCIMIVSINIIIIIYEDTVQFSGRFVTCVIVNNNNNNNFDRSSRILFLWFSPNYNRSSLFNSKDCIKTINKN